MFFAAEFKSVVKFVVVYGDYFCHIYEVVELGYLNPNRVPVNELKTGDVVSIKTNKSSSGPTLEWLKNCKTSHAKPKIKAFLNTKQHEQFVERGLELFISRITMLLGVAYFALALFISLQ